MISLVCLYELLYIILAFLLIGPSDGLLTNYFLDAICSHRLNISHDVVLIKTRRQKVCPCIFTAYCIGLRVLWKSKADFWLASKQEVAMACAFYHLFTGRCCAFVLESTYTIALACIYLYQHLKCTVLEHEKHVWLFSYRAYRLLISCFSVSNFGGHFGMMYSYIENEWGKGPPRLMWLDL